MLKYVSFPVNPFIANVVLFQSHQRMKPMFLFHISEIISFLIIWGVLENNFDQKWINNLITFQKINLHLSNDWSNSKVFFTSDKVWCDFFFSKWNVYTWLIKLKILLEIFLTSLSPIRYWNLFKQFTETIWQA